MTQYQSEAKWPLGFCISLDKSHTGEENVPLDMDEVQYPGIWIKWLQTHQWLPSAQWVMLINSAIKCIVNSCYLSVYGWGTREFGKDHQAVKCWHQVENILSLSDSCSSRAEECLVKSPWCIFSCSQYQWKVWTRLLIQVNGKVCPNFWLVLFTYLFAIKDLRLLTDELVFSFIKKNILAVHNIAERLSRIICNSLLEAALWTAECGRTWSGTRRLGSSFQETTWPPGWRWDLEILGLLEMVLNVAVTITSRELKGHFSNLSFYWWLQEGSATTAVSSYSLSLCHHPHPWQPSRLFELQWLLINMDNEVVFSQQRWANENTGPRDAKYCCDNTALSRAVWVLKWRFLGFATEMWHCSLSCSLPLISYNTAGGFWNSSTIERWLGVVPNLRIICGILYQEVEVSRWEHAPNLCLTCEIEIWIAGWVLL